MTANDASDARVYDFPARQAQTDTTEPAPESPEEPSQTPEDAGEDGPTRVDSVEAQAPPTLGERITNADWRPLVPAWARSRAELADAARWAGRYYAHAGTYHALRAPKYAGKLAGRAPRGAVRVVAGAARWAGDAEGTPVRAAAVRREDPEQYLKLSRQRDVRVRARTIAVATAAGLTVAGGITAYLLAPTWALWAGAAALVAVLGVVGAPADRPLLDRAVTSTDRS